MTWWALMFELVLADLKEIGYACDTPGCCEIATVIAHWPGQDAKRCEGHRVGACRIAEALGFPLHTTPLPVRRFDVAPDDAAVRAGLLELT